MQRLPESSDVRPAHPLTEAQSAILTYLHKYRSDAHYTNWIAEGCGRFYETAWASSRLPGLVKRGLVEKTGPGIWRITKAGSVALAGPQRSEVAEAPAHPTTAQDPSQ